MTLAEARARQDEARAETAARIDRQISSYARAVAARRPAHELAARRAVAASTARTRLVLEARAFTGARLPA